MLPTSMNYFKKLDAVGGSNSKLRLSAHPTNGSSFTSSSSTIEITIPCNQPGLFADLKNGYLSMSIKNGVGTSAKKLHGKIGTFGLIKKVRCENSSNLKFSEVENWNVLAGMKLQESVDANWIQSNGRVMCGTGLDSVTGGEAIAANATINKIVPFTFNSLAEQTLTPLCGRENIKLQFELESALTACIGSGTAALATDLTISSVKFYYDAYKLDEDSYKGLLQDVGGVFRISQSDYLHQSDLIAAAADSALVNIGFSKRKMKALYFCLRTNTNLVLPTCASLTSRNKGGITSYALKYNGSIIGQNAINTSTTDQAETYAELMKSSGHLLNLHGNDLGFNATFNLEEGSGLTDGTTCGAYFGKINLENGFETDEAISGLEVLNGNLQLEITKGTSAAQQRIDIFVEYHSELVLDMNDGQSWSVYS